MAMDPLYAQFADVFKKFALPGEDVDLPSGIASAETKQSTENGEQPTAAGTEGDDNHSDDEGSPQTSTVKHSRNRKLRDKRITVAELKQKVKRPDLVEWVDTTARDPQLLVHLKSIRNSVPVPEHWSRKRKYLQGKRAMEKSAFELPDFIQATGIQTMRDAAKEKEDAKKLKSKTRERVQPKMGKLGLDYQKLHDAFFRFQTKPPLTLPGDLYFEGKESEAVAKEFKPGQLSDALIEALNIPPLAPPPWLINMQRYGPPPNYPNLRIPGLNAPIPEGAQWGFHPGGWGKPPVDEFNRPLYGNVFLTNSNADGAEPINRERWGELVSDEEEEEESEDESMAAGSEAGDEEAADGEVEEEGTGRAEVDGMATPSGLASVAGGLETPAQIELRKTARPAPPTAETTPRSLYQVLEQKDTAVSGFMGSQHVYDVAGSNHAQPSSTAAPSATKKTKLAMDAGVDLALDPAEMATLDEQALRAKYEASLQEAQKATEVTPHEDFSDLVAEHAGKQAKKRKQMADGKDKAAKKLRDFKF